MTQFDQDRAEAEDHLPRFGIDVCGARRGSDPPDVVFDYYGMGVGLEVTRYAADEDQRILEAAWREMLEHTSRLLNDNDPLRRIDVTLRLNTDRKLPPRLDREPFVLAMIEFLRAWLQRKFEEEEVPYSTLSGIPVVGDYVDELVLRRADCWSEWHCIEAHSRWKPDAADIIGDIVLTKTEKHWARLRANEDTFSDCDQYWLLVHGHRPIDATIAIINPDILTEAHSLKVALERSPFDRVCISGIDAAEWRRDTGWRYLES